MPRLPSNSKKSVLILPLTNNAMKYWKIMAGRQSSHVDEFKEKSVVAIGFAHSDAILKAKTVDEMRRIVAQEHPTAAPGRVIMWGSELYRFYHEMKNGDRVLVYEPTTRLYHLGEVAGDAGYHEKEELPHIRAVKWLRTLPRDDFSVATRNALGSVLALFEVSVPAQVEIERYLSGKAIETAGSEPEAVEDVNALGDDIYERSQEFIKDAIVKLDWQQVQELVAGLLRAMGYKTRVSPPGSDRGKDIIASPDGLGLEEPRISVEVKHRPNSQMGAPEIRAFAGGLRDSKGVYVSTGGFSREAHYEAERAQTPVLLIDIDELASLITQYYEQCDADTRALLPLRKMYWTIK